LIEILFSVFYKINLLSKLLFTIFVIQIDIVLPLKTYNKPVAKKSMRLLKPVTTFSRSIVISGNTATRHRKTFTFKVISAAQQMRERNKSYKFFTID